MCQVYTSSEPFLLESGKILPCFHLSYTTHGQLNERGDNVIWIFHALTANSNPVEWWYGLVGNNRLLNPDQFFIICINMPGSCYGSINPLDTDPQTGEPYCHRFPLITIKDMVRMYQLVKVHLGIKKIHLGMGGSMGGQQLLEWAIEEPELFEYIVPIATNAIHSPWGIAFNATQRMCIESDASWKSCNENAGMEGMKIARAIALLSYRHYQTYQQSQAGYVQEGAENKLFKAETYQKYQGEKLAKRFNAFSYYYLSKAMDSHDIGRGRTSVEDALKSIRAKTLVIGIQSDVLFPVEEQAFLARHIPYAQLAIIHSFYGHDGFLLEFEQISKYIRQLISS